MTESRTSPPRVAILLSHPIQYFVPWLAELNSAKDISFEVLYGFKPDPKQQGAAYGLEYAWDRPILEGYRYRFLKNESSNPSTSFGGIDTPEIASIIANREYDAWIICGWNTKSYLQAINGCHRAGVPMAVRGDSHLLSKRSFLRRAIKEFTHRRLITRFSAFLAVGKHNAAYYRHYGALESTIHEVRHFVDNGYFAKEADRYRGDHDALREGWDIPPGAFVFLYVGRIIESKQIELLLEAFQNVQKRVQRVHLLLAGEGDYRKTAESFAAKRSLHVTFTGFLNQGDLPKAYAVSNVLVLPSRETWGLVVNEAMACGIPAIVTDETGCAPDLIPNSSTGTVVPYDNTPMLAQAMLNYVENPENAAEQGKAAQKLVHCHYSPKGAAHNTAKAMQSIL